MDHPDPHVAEMADLDEWEKSLDTNAQRLDQIAKFVEELRSLWADIEKGEPVKDIFAPFAPEGTPETLDPKDIWPETLDRNTKLIAKWMKGLK